MNMFRYFQLSTLAVAGVALLAGGQELAAQSYGSQWVKNIQNVNSSNRFSTQRVQRRLHNQSGLRVGVFGVNQRSYLTPSNNQGPRYRAEKPFANIDRGPSVSPYLQLSNPFSTASDYYNIVRPQQEQQRINARVQRQIERQRAIQQQKLNQVAAQGPYDITGDEDRAPTGHTTVFMETPNFLTTGAYFPPVTNPKEQ